MIILYGHSERIFDTALFVILKESFVVLKPSERSDFFDVDFLQKNQHQKKSLRSAPHHMLERRAGRRKLFFKMIFFAKKIILKNSFLQRSLKPIKKKSNLFTKIRLISYTFMPWVWLGYNSLFFLDLVRFQKNANCFHSDRNFRIVKGIMDEFSFAVRMYNSSSPQNFQMLRRDGLLQFQRIVNFVDVNSFVFVHKFNYFHPQRMCQRAQHIGRHLQLLVVDVNLCLSHRPQCLFLVTK
jgi:hypothetical protein